MEWATSTYAQIGAWVFLLSGAGLVIRALWTEKLAADARERGDRERMHAQQTAWIEALGAVAKQLERLETATRALADAARSRP